MPLSTAILRKKRHGSAFIGALLTPQDFTWDGNTLDATPNVSARVDPTTTVGDIFYIRIASVSDMSVIDTTLDNTIDGSELSGELASFSTTDLLNGTYYMDLMHYRPSLNLYSGRSSVIAVVVNVGYKNYFAGFTFHNNSDVRDMFAGFTFHHEEAL